jgi:tetratricopeptide (TPR) repeat protein
MGDFAGATADFGKACELEPDNEEACFNQGKAAYLGNDFETALAILGEMAPTSTQPKVWIQLARTQKKMGMIADATASATKAAELDPESADAYYELGTIEYDRHKKSKQYDVAIAAYLKALELAPDHANAFAANFKLGKMYYRTKQYAEAEAAFAKALEIRPDYAGAYVDLGNSRNKLDNPDGAIEAYQKAIEIKAPEPYGMAYYSLGRVYWGQDDPEAAIEAYQKSMTDPSFKHADKAQEAIVKLEEYIAKKKKAGGVY